jgi:hypothetical protein
MKSALTWIVTGVCTVITSAGLFAAETSTPVVKQSQVVVEKSAKPLLYRTGNDNLLVAPAVSKEQAKAEIAAAGGNSYALAINHGSAVRAMGVVHVDGRTLLVANPEAYQSRVAAAKKNADVKVATAETPAR